MKVFYEKSMMAQVVAEIDLAKYNGQTISKIVLSSNEFDSFMVGVKNSQTTDGAVAHFLYNMPKRDGKRISVFYDVRIEEEV